MYIPKFRYRYPCTVGEVAGVDAYTVFLIKLKRGYGNFSTIISKSITYLNVPKLSYPVPSRYPESMFTVRVREREGESERVGVF